MKKTAFYILFIILLSSSCTSTEKFLKTATPDQKYAKAMEWYNKGAYFKAIPVFEELMGLLKGKESVEEIYYYYCMAQYKQGSYILSAFHFKNYVTKHPYSQHTEEALFMHAESYFEQSPKYNLDQTETIKAIDAYQVFINQYPASNRVSTCNDKIDELREKLEAKALKAADLYYKTQNYRAAAFSYKNLLIDYPDIDDPEEIQFKVVKSFYKYAEQSISAKQQERYEDAIKVANNFLARYQNSKYKTIIEETREEAHYNAIKGAYTYALLSNLDKRDKNLQQVYEVYDVHKTMLTEPKLKEDAEKIKEDVTFHIVKTHFQQAQNLDYKDRKTHYIETITAFNTFKQAYGESKYMKEAERIYYAAQKNLKKISNG